MDDVNTTAAEGGKKIGKTKRVDALYTALLKGPIATIDLAAELGTTARVISNDLCDIRRALPLGDRLLRRRENGQTLYWIEQKSPA